MTVIKLQDGKYEIERDENGLMVGMWRNGEFWKSGLELFAHAQAFHAALDEIERLLAEPKDNSLAALRDMLRAEVDRLIAGSATPAADLERARNAGFVEASRIAGRQIEATQAQYNAVIDFAIKQGLEASTFLQSWREGDTSEWPEFVAPHGQ